VLRNRVILVTNGASGIGLGIAQGLASHGAELIVTGATQAQIDDAVAKLGFYATGVLADLSKVADAECLVARIQATHGRLDVLILTTATVADLPIGKITERAFDQMFDANIKGVAFTIQAARSIMGDGGSVVIIGDHVPSTYEQGMGLRHAAKSALRSLVEGWTTDLGEIGVRVNLLSGCSATSPVGSISTASNKELLFSSRRNRFSFEPNSSQREIIQVATFLASDTSHYLNGVELLAGKR